MIWYVLSIVCAVISIVSMDHVVLALGLIFSVIGMIRERR
jgi:hypothetical protein